MHGMRDTVEKMAVLTAGVSLGKVKEMLPIAKSKADEGVVLALFEMKKRVKSPDEVVRRDLRPQDLIDNKYDWKWSFNVSGPGWVDLVVKDVDDDHAIAIYGFRVINRGPVTQIEIRKGPNNGLKAYADIDSADSETGYIILEDGRPVVIEPSNTLRIRAYVTGSGEAEIQILGRVGEPATKTILDLTQ